MIDTPNWHNNAKIDEIMSITSCCVSFTDYMLITSQMLDQNQFSVQHLNFAQERSKMILEFLVNFRFYNNCEQFYVN